MLTGKISPQEEHILRPQKKPVSDGVFQLCGNPHFCQQDATPTPQNQEKSKISFKKLLKKSFIPQIATKPLQTTIPIKYQKISINHSLGSKFLNSDGYNYQVPNHLTDDSYIRSTKYPIAVNQNSHVKINIAYESRSVSSFVQPIKQKIQNAHPLEDKHNKEERELFPMMPELKKVQSLATFAARGIPNSRESSYRTSEVRQPLNLCHSISVLNNNANDLVQPHPHTQRRKFQKKTTGGFADSMNMQRRSADFPKQLISCKKAKAQTGEAWQSVRKTQTLRDHQEQNTDQSKVIQDFALLMKRVREHRLETWDINEQMIEI